MGRRTAVGLLVVACVAAVLGWAGAATALPADVRLNIQQAAPEANSQALGQRMGP